MNSNQLSPLSSTNSSNVLYSSSPPSNSLPSTSPDQSFSPSFMISAKIFNEDIHSKIPKNSFAIQQILGLSENVAKTQEIKGTSSKNDQHASSSCSPPQSFNQSRLLDKQPFFDTANIVERICSLKRANNLETQMMSLAQSSESVNHLFQSLTNPNINAFLSRNEHILSSSLWKYFIPSPQSMYHVRPKTRGPRRQRTTFTHEQTLRLEMEYHLTEYISRSKRFQLAYLLELTENQIKIWFQNRRAKDKRIEKAILEQQYRYNGSNAEMMAEPMNIDNSMHFPKQDRNFNCNGSNSQTRKNIDPISKSNTHTNTVKSEFS
ncbi:uncharacterized protein LOC141855261 isoform X1 [Brevipalpus obovatus]|uniref:uncharacterized protein LOC141855261 isoform X1 n=1 Tax=Brevipalpus obovatus TaxID=246614 RepID=UPI003D9F82BF